MITELTATQIEIKALYVSEKGDDNKTGNNKDTSVKTIAHGLDLARKQNVKKLILLPGKYEGQVNLMDGIDICGQKEITEADLIYSGKGDRSAETYSSKYAVLVNPGEGPTVIASNILTSTILSNVIIIGKDDSINGYGVVVTSDKKPDKSFLQLTNIKIMAAKGKKGKDGTKVATSSGYDALATGGKGGYNTNVDNHIAALKGTDAANSPNGGGAPGKNAEGYYEGDTNGYFNAGSKLPYTYGDTKRWNVYLKEGDAGGTGRQGNEGSSGKANADVHGAFQKLFWKGQSGNAGVGGYNGSGGGGAGAGACYAIGSGWNWTGSVYGTYCYANLVGMQGGDGGQGGKGGYSGTGGEAGAASFALLIINTVVTLENISIIKGSGGDGGAGADGGKGSTGEAGHAGTIPAKPDACHATDRWPGKGGNGGNGGDGGWGGAGAGGNGGISIGIALVNGGKMIKQPGIFYMAGGTPGKGGHGGAVNGNINAESGLNGISSFIYEFK